MSIYCTTGSLKGEARREVIEEVQQHLRQAAREAVSQVMTVFLEEEVTAQLGRSKGELRHMSGQPRTIGWRCRGCGCQDAHQFIRDGHYQRGLETGWGHLEQLRVPMVECQVCGHDVVCEYVILEKAQRYWLDLEQDALFGSGFGDSLRHLSERWSGLLETSVGIRTINERINQLAPLVQQFHRTPIAEVPMVVQFDGIWLTLQTSQEERTCDSRKRRRKKRAGKRVVVLVALGYWPQDGRREVLDWEIAPGEDQPSWETLLHRLWQRGVQAEQGLQMVVRDGCGSLGEAVALVYGTGVIEQRCIFHKLRNVADKSRTELKGQDAKANRQQLLEQAAQVYEAHSPEEARQQLAAWAEQWRLVAPATVATFQRDFEQTIAYFALPDVAQQWLRTTSHLERINRELRHRFRQAVTFGSRKGLDVALYLQAQRLLAQWTKRSWWDVSHHLSFDLADLDP
jgi:hypothetical protein